MRRFALLLLLLLPGMAPAAEESEPPAPLPPAYAGLAYRLPEPGSYELPPLGEAGDGEVLDMDGSRLRLHELFGDKYVLLTFIYTHCNDANGCPLNAFVFHRIKRKMQKDRTLAENLRLVNVSFDPERDTPAAMARYAENFSNAGPKGEWRFLTTASPQRLQPLLEAYGQDIQRKLTADGKATAFSHILRVFLIDRKKRIRNIYSVAFLHPDLLVNDVKTLMAEEKRHAKGEAAERESPSALSGPGDDRHGYERVDYRTHARALASRKGKAADLVSLVRHPPLGLPPVPVPPLNPITEEKVALGRALFYDRRLSLNNTFSCAMCHIPEQGFTSNELATAVGIEGRSVRRNAPTLYNSAYSSLLFHDGREENLEQQIWGPLLAKNEMGNPSVGAVLSKIRSTGDYAARFRKVFGERGLTMDTLGMAIASYERTLVSGDSPFDRWRFGGDEKALSEAAKRGYRLFTGKAGCSGCHVIGERWALFTDHSLRNTGVGYRESMGGTPERQRVQLAPGVFAEVDRKIIESVGEAPPPDLGRYEVTQDPADRWKYRVPSLRNVALTAPYMHNGSLPTLEAVVAFYNAGGVPNPELDPLIHPLELSAAEQKDLVAFLKSLTGGNVDLLVADAFAAPVGDVGAGNSPDTR